MSQKRNVIQKSFSVWVNPELITTNRLSSQFYAPEFIELDAQLMAAPFAFDKLGNLGKLVSGPFGSQLPSSVYTDRGIPLLRVQNLKDLQICYDHLVFIAVDTHQRLQRSSLRAGDLAISKAGSLGTVAQIPASMPVCNITEHIVGVRVNDEQVHSSYLAVFLASKFGSFQLRRQGVGTLLKYLGVDDTRKVSIALPPRRIQEHIGAKLLLAERYRESAVQAIGDAERTLTSIARLNEFHPRETTHVMVGRNALTQRLTAEFYRSKYIDFERHLLELDFPCVRLGTVLAEPIQRVSSPAERSADGIPCLSVSDIDPYYIDTRDPLIRVPPPLYRARPHSHLRAWDVLYTCVGPPVGEAALVIPELLPVAGGGDISVLRPRAGLDAGYLCAVLNSFVGKLQIERYSHGIRQQRVFADELEDFLVPVPNEATQHSIGEAVAAYERNHIKSAELVAEARDDVEALIEGRLDVSAILSGRVQPPTKQEVLNG